MNLWSFFIINFHNLENIITCNSGCKFFGGTKDTYEHGLCKNKNLKFKMSKKDWESNVQNIGKLVFFISQYYLLISEMTLFCVR